MAESDKTVEQVNLDQSGEQVNPDKSVEQFNPEELGAWLRSRPPQFKNEADMEAICDSLRENEIDGESFVDLTEADIGGILPDGTQRFVLRRKQLRDIVSRLKEEGASPPSPPIEVSVPVEPSCTFMLVQTPGITAPEIPEQTFHAIVRDQVAVMVTATKQLQPPRRPTNAEMEAVARQLVQKYPALGREEENPNLAHVTLYAKMKRRLGNKTPVTTPRGPRKNKVQTDGLRRSPRKRKQEDQKSNLDDSDSDSSLPGTSEEKKGSKARSESSTSVTPKEKKGKKVRKDLLAGSHPGETSGCETAYTTDRHYKLLMVEVNKTRPNYETVQHLLDLEFPARKQFAAAINQPGARAAKVLKRYPCFRDARHLQDELQRYVAGSDKTFLNRVKEQLPHEAELIVRYAIDRGLHKKTEMPDWVPGKKIRKALQLLPQLFPGLSSPPIPHKDMLLVMLGETDSVEEEIARSRKRTGFLIVKKMGGKKGVQVYVVVNGEPLTACGSVMEGFVSLAGALYCFAQPHPPSIAPAMVFLEHHILKDVNLNPCDLESKAFKKAYADYIAFSQKFSNTD